MKNILVKFYTANQAEYIGSSLGLEFVYNQTIDQAGEWSVKVLNQDFMEEIDITYEVEILVENEIIVESRIADISYNVVDSALIYTFAGRDRLDDLFLYPGSFRANFGISNGLNITYIGALAFLLDKAGWRLGDISSLSSPTSPIVSDLTKEATLLNQVTKLIQERPDTFYRYGGIKEGFKTLDVGDFYEDKGEVLTNSQAPLNNEGYYYLSDPNITKKDEIISAVVPLGGEYSGRNVTYNIGTGTGTNVNVNLTTSLNQNLDSFWRWAYLEQSEEDSEFPILELEAGQPALVVNTNLFEGGIIKYHPKKTDNIGPCSGAYVGLINDGSWQYGFCQNFRSLGGSLTSFTLYPDFYSNFGGTDSSEDIHWKILSNRVATNGTTHINVNYPGTTLYAEGTFTLSSEGFRPQTITLGTPLEIPIGTRLWLCVELNGQTTGGHGHVLQCLNILQKSSGAEAEDQGEAGNHLDKGNVKDDCYWWGGPISCNSWLFRTASDPSNGDSDYQTVTELISTVLSLRMEVNFESSLSKYPIVTKEWSDLVPYWGYYDGLADDPINHPAGNGWIFPITELYNRAINFLKSSSETYFNVGGKIYGDLQSKVGDQVKVQGTWEIDQYDPITERFTKTQQTINTSLRIVSKKIVINIEEEYTEVKLNNKTVNTSKDNSTIALYDTLIRNRSSTDEGTIYQTPFPPKIDQDSEVVSGFSLHSSATMEDGSTGVFVEFTTTAEAYQFDYTNLSYVSINTDTREERPSRLILAGMPYAASGEPLIIEVVQWPDIGTPLQVRLRYVDREWSASENDTFYCYILRLS